MKRKFLKRSSKDFQKRIPKDFQKAFTNMEKHDIINISNETTADRNKESYDNQKKLKKLFKKCLQTQ